MAEKRGRPKKEFGKEYCMTVRLSFGDVHTLDYISEVTRKSRSEIIREGIKEMYKRTIEGY